MLLGPESREGRPRKSQLSRSGNAASVRDLACRYRLDASVRDDQRAESLVLLANPVPATNDIVFQVSDIRALAALHRPGDSEDEI